MPEHSQQSGCFFHQVVMMMKDPNIFMGQHLKALHTYGDSEFWFPLEKTKNQGWPEPACVFLPLSPVHCFHICIQGLITALEMCNWLYLVRCGFSCVYDAFQSWMKNGTFMNIKGASVLPQQEQPYIYMCARTCVWIMINLARSPQNKQSSDHWLSSQLWHSRLKAVYDHTFWVVSYVPVEPRWVML